MPLKDRWSDMTSSDWDAFAKAWLAELRPPAPPVSDDLDGVGGAVTLMNSLRIQTISGSSSGP
jgi:hypothetical protein